MRACAWCSSASQVLSEGVLPGGINCTFLLAFPFNSHALHTQCNFHRLETKQYDFPMFRLLEQIPTTSRFAIMYFTITMYVLYYYIEIDNRRLCLQSIFVQLRRALNGFLRSTLHARRRWHNYSAGQFGTIVCDALYSCRYRINSHLTDWNRNRIHLPFTHLLTVVKAKQKAICLFASSYHQVLRKRILLGRCISRKSSHPVVRTAIK